LNGTERVHSILVERPRKIKQRCGKRATLLVIICGDLPDQDLGLEDETGEVRRKAVSSGWSENEGNDTISEEDATRKG